MQFSQIEYKIENQIAHIILSNPQTLNAIDVLMAEEISAALDDAQVNARVVIISGSGRAFCSGANLAGRDADFDNKNRDTGARLESHYNPLILKLQNSGIPIITMVNGAAAGIGASIALMGDIILASESAYFLQAFVNIGLVPDGGAPYLLTRAIGRVRAMELMLLGEKLSAAKALEYGLITKLCDDESLFTQTQEIAQKLAAGPRTAISLIRASCWNALDNELDAQLDLERQQQKQAGASKDFKEGVSAFLQKRKPNFD